MFADERRQAILGLVHSGGPVSLRELARRVGSSEVTVRRDLRLLADQGLVDRRHGGAAPPGGLGREAPYAEKADVAADEKAAMAEVALSLVDSGDAVTIGAGTTTQALARRLATCADLTVMTNSLLVAQALAGARGVEVVLTGGSLRGPILGLVGTAAEASLVDVRTRRAFLSGNGLTGERGLSTPSAAVAGVDRAMVASAAELVVLADSTKIGVDTMTLTATTEEIDHLVTTTRAPAEQVERLRELGVQVHLAEVPPRAEDAPPR
ncbi:DeoR/GlpR family DNA-binding transcription regulator [Pseudokineococcus basanitobsidens]|uniref:DeoR/GlpR family DNA-binding transcription regulator n=1 Tax=Pseudokineococcus basanitobsidens TaxID=1926649 RepID=A0ABU8RH94_9ACTN